MCDLYDDSSSENEVNCINNAFEIKDILKEAYSLDFPKSNENEKKEAITTLTSTTDASRSEKISLECFHNSIKKNLNPNYTKPTTILKDMIDNLIEVDIETLNMLLYNCLNNKDSDEFEEIKKIIFSKEKGSKSSPDGTTYIILIKFQKLKSKNILKQLISTYSKKENIYSNNEYQIYHKKERKDSFGHNHNHHFHKVKINKELQTKKEEHYKEFDDSIEAIRVNFEKFDLAPSIQVYNILLDYYLEQKRFDYAWKHFEYLRVNDYCDEYSYSTMLKGIHLANDLSVDWLDKAFEMLSEAETKFNELEEILYNTLLDACVKFNRIDKAEELFCNMKMNKDHLSEHTYSIMIKAYGKTKNLEKAQYIFDQIKSNFEMPSNITYGCMMNLYVKCGYTDLAKDLMIEMDGKGISQNLHTYSTLINGYRIARNFKSALAIFERAQKEKEQNIVIYNAILDCSIQCEEYNKMKEIFVKLNENAKVDSKYPQPDLITYSIVMKGLSKTDDFERILEVYTYLLERNDLEHDKHMYNIVMDYFAKKKEEKMVIMVYNDMKMRNIEIEIVTYGILIKLYCNLNNCFRALELYDELLSKKMKPNVVILQSIMKVLFKNKDQIDKAINMFRNIRTYNDEIELDDIIYELVITNCLKNCKIEEAFEFYQKSHNDNIIVDVEFLKHIVETAAYNDKIQISTKKNFLKKIFEFVQEKKLNSSFEIDEILNAFLNNDQEKNKQFKSKFKLRLSQNKFKNYDGNNNYDYYNQNHHKNQNMYHNQRQNDKGYKYGNCNNNGNSKLNVNQENQHQYESESGSRYGYVYGYGFNQKYSNLYNDSVNKVNTTENINEYDDLYTYDESNNSNIDYNNKKTLNNNNNNNQNQNQRKENNNQYQYYNTNIKYQNEFSKDQTEYYNKTSNVSTVPISKLNNKFECNIEMKNLSEITFDFENIRPFENNLDGCVKIIKPVRQENTNNTNNSNNYSNKYYAGENFNNTSNNSTYYKDNSYSNKYQNNNNSNYNHNPIKNYQNQNNYGGNTNSQNQNYYYKNDNGQQQYQHSNQESKFSSKYFNKDHYNNEYYK